MPGTWDEVVVRINGQGDNAHPRSCIALAFIDRFLDHLLERLSSIIILSKLCVRDAT
ncbi:hypothetical protein [Mesorhizobium sp. M0106]|uniref:hypothetical protein n=1 Tax=Mesorhizobium sp. M0106 TaxID=2956880 RepID=UPI003338E56A